MRFLDNRWRIYVITTYGNAIAGSGTEERKRGTVGPVVAGGSAAPWLRNWAINPIAFARRATIQRGLALSAPLPIGKAWLDSWALGRKARATANAADPARK